MRTKLLVVSLCLFAALIAGGLSGARGQAEQACSDLALLALESVEQSCANLDRDQACYGYNRVDATFWEARDDLVFSHPSDRVNLLDLQSLTTAPLDLAEDQWGVALLHLRANVPESLPGQAVTFLLMGDASLENAVPPEAVSAPVEPLAALALQPTNLRSRPTRAANVVSSVPAGAALALIGANEARDWYEVLLDNGSHAWALGELLQIADADALAALPVTLGPSAVPRYGPMQAFYFTTGLGEAACHDAPNALLVQSRDAYEIALNVNSLDVRLHSTALFTQTTLDDGSRALVITLLEGGAVAELEDSRIVLNTPGESLGVTLDDDGLVSAESLVIEPSAEVLEPIVQGGCAAADLPGLLSASGQPVDCGSVEVNFAPPFPDADGDGVADGVDNCPLAPNLNQQDADGDGLGDACDGAAASDSADADGDGIPDSSDNCPIVANPGQQDADANAIGDACDQNAAPPNVTPADRDRDGVLDGTDNCPLVPNPGQEDADADGLGNACDQVNNPTIPVPDADGDGVLDGADNCPFTANPGQQDFDGDGSGDACDADNDGDGVLDGADNCPAVPNPGQQNIDADGDGDACDNDDDNDGAPDGTDNCPYVYNPPQEDFDGDGLGNECDTDDDADGVPDVTDNCPYNPNPAQEDADVDGVGDACDM